MTSGIEHLFIGLLVILSFFGKLKFFVYLNIGVFFLLTFKTFLYSQDLSSLSVICIVHIFSQSVPCLFIFLTVFGEGKLLIFMKISISIFSFMVCALGLLRNFCLPQSCEDFLLCFILEVL